MNPIKELMRGTAKDWHGYAEQARVRRLAATNEYDKAGCDREEQYWRGMARGMETAVDMLGPDPLPTRETPEQEWQRIRKTETHRVQVRAAIARGEPDADVEALDPAFYGDTRVVDCGRYGQVEQAANGEYRFVDGEGK